MPVTRRELCSMLPAALLPAILPSAASAQQDSGMPSQIFPFDKLPVQTPNGANGAKIRAVLKGRLATGESLEVHETTLPPGGAPHPAHHHEHTEMWLIREGTVEITIEGKPHRLSGGSLAMVRSNEEHGITNPSDKPVTYFVVAVGPGADK